MVGMVFRRGTIHASNVGAALAVRCHQNRCCCRHNSNCHHDNPRSYRRGSTAHPLLWAVWVDRRLYGMSYGSMKQPAMQSWLEKTNKCQSLQRERLAKKMSTIQSMTYLLLVPNPGHLFNTWPFGIWRVHCFCWHYDNVIV